MDAHWSRPEDVPQPPRHGPSPTRSATPPPVSSRAGSRSPSPVLHALLPSAACQGPASASLQDPPARVPSPPPAPLRARSLGLGFSLSGSLGRSPQALAEVPSSGSLQTPLFASPALPPSPGLRGSLHGPLPLDFLSRESPHDLLGAHLSLGPPTDEALLVAAPLHAQPSHAPVPNQPLAAATPYHGMGPEVSAPLFGRAADARLEEGDQRAEAEGRNEEEWRQQERTARRTEEGWQGEVVGGADERDGGGRIPSSAGQTKAGAHKRGGSFGGFDLESNDASELDALMECEEEPEQRKATPEIEYGRHDRPGHQDEERAGAIARSFQQAFTDRTVRMASLDTGRDASRGWRSMREESAGEDTWQPGARDEARDRIKLTSYRMELRRDVRARLPPGRSPSPYSLRMSTLQRTRPPAREQQPGGAARADRHEEQHGGARPARQDSPGKRPRDSADDRSAWIW